MGKDRGFVSECVFCILIILFLGSAVYYIKMEKDKDNKWNDQCNSLGGVGVNKICFKKEPVIEVNDGR